MNTIKVTYRDIAKILVKAMPLDGQDYAGKINEYLGTIKAMPQEAKVALKSAYIFSRKVPREEREDLFQDLTLAILRARTKDERLAYTIARCDWQNWWEKRFVRQDKVCLLTGLPKPQNHSTCKFIHKPEKCCKCPFRAFRQMVKSLDSVVEDTEGNQASFGELLVGETEFELKMDGELDAQRLYDRLPEGIKYLVDRRLMGYSLKKLERECLERWAAKNAMMLVS